MVDELERLDGNELIKGYVTYEEYLALPQFKSYVDEKRIELPSPVIGKAVAKEENMNATSAVCKKKKANVGVIITALFGLLFVTAALAAGYLIKDNSAAVGFFAIYDGQNAIELCKKLIAGEYVEVLSLIAAVCGPASVIAEVAFGVIGALCRVAKRGMGMCVIIGVFVAFALITTSQVIGLVEGKTASNGAVPAVISAIIFVVATVTGTGKERSKENV